MKVKDSDRLRIIGAVDEANTGADASATTGHRLIVGSKVATEFGHGTVIGKDLPESKRAWRWLVKIQAPNERGKRWIKLFGYDVMAFFPRELDVGHGMTDTVLNAS
jgi:hypothetical protein